MNPLDRVHQILGSCVEICNDRFPETTCTLWRGSREQKAYRNPVEVTPSQHLLVVINLDFLLVRFG